MVLISINDDHLTNLNKKLKSYSNYQILIHELSTISDKDDDISHTIHLNGIDNEGLVYKITNELAKIAEIQSNMALLEKTKEIPNITLKSIVTNQSLYL